MTLNKTFISKVLRSCVFDPKSPGPMQPIIDVGSQFYYENRAIECIKAGQRTMAIKLLALAEAMHSQP